MPTTETIYILLTAFLSIHISFGQEFEIDSCGLDSNPVLNNHEIAFFDSIMFAPYNTKKSGTIDPKGGFDFKNKKIAFFSCTINSNNKGEGLLSKKEFFKLIKPDLIGHAGRGLIKFNDNEKIWSKGYDAVIIIDCLICSDDLKEKIITMIVNEDN